MKGFCERVPLKFWYRRTLLSGVSQSLLDIKESKQRPDSFSRPVWSASYWTALHSKIEHAGINSPLQLPMRSRLLRRQIEGISVGGKKKEIQKVVSLSFDQLEIHSRQQGRTLKDTRKILHDSVLPGNVCFISWRHWPSQMLQQLHFLPGCFSTVPLLTSQLKGIFQIKCFTHYCNTEMNPGGSLKGVEGRKSAPYFLLESLMIPSSIPTPCSSGHSRKDRQGKCSQPPAQKKG